MKKSALSISGAMVVVTILLAATSWGAMWGNTMNITTGADIVRTLTDVQNAGYVYGAKQSYDGLAGTTHVWLPYGNADGVYYDANNVGMSEAGAGTLAMIITNGGGSSCSLVYKFHFDQPVATLKLNAGWSYCNLISDGTDVIALAAEYSTDGATWTSVAGRTSVTNPGESVVEPWVNSLVTGLSNQDVYLRFGTYNQTNPADTDGGARYMQLRASGAGEWGEAGFFGNQMQLEVTTVPEPAALSLLALGALALFRRRR